MKMHEIARLVECAEAQAWADYCSCALADFAAKYGARVRRTGTAWVTMIPRLDDVFFNRINALGIDDAASEAVLDEAIGMLAGAGCTNYMAQVSPLAQPPELLQWLTARGFRSGRNWAKLYRGDEPARFVKMDLGVRRLGLNTRPHSARSRGQPSRCRRSWCPS